MEEIIKIAFSTLNSRVESNEKEIIELTKSLDGLLALIQKNSEKISILEKTIDGKNAMERDELEVYKFGER